MSAFIVSKADIDVLATALHERKIVAFHPKCIGQILWAQNHNSVNLRYSEQTGPELGSNTTVA